MAEQSVPHKCPKCEGEGKVPDRVLTAGWRTCPACGGACIVWSPVAPVVVEPRMTTMWQAAGDAAPTTSVVLGQGEVPPGVATAQMVYGHTQYRNAGETPHA